MDANESLFVLVEQPARVHSIELVWNFAHFGARANCNFVEILKVSTVGYIHNGVYYILI